MPIIRPVIDLRLGAIALRQIASEYSTTFPLTENPLSQGSIWTHGGDVGLDWQNVQCAGGSPGSAYGTGVSDISPSVLFNDNIATLQSSGLSTSAFWLEMLVRDDAGYTPAAAHEIELLMMTISAHSAIGYEMDFTLTLTPARWNGAAGDFTTGFETTISGSTFTPADGDRVRAEYDSTSGSPVFTLYSGTGAIGGGLTGLTQRWKFTDTTAGKIVSAYPGMGHFYRPGVSPADFPKRSIKGFGCGNL